MNTFAKKLIHEKGKQYYAGPLPEEIMRGKVGDCFDWCLVIAKMFPKYRYVEGGALIQGKWYHHAWLTEDGKTALDPTWGAVNKEGKFIPLSMVHYVGVEMETEKVMAFVLDTGYKAVLKNYYRNHELAKKIYETSR